MKYVLGAISLLLLIVVIGGAAFYLGQKSLTNNPSSITIQNNALPSSSVSQSQTPTPTGIQTKTVTAGGVLVFSAYSVSVPPTWTSAKNTGQNMDTLTLTNDPYKITISQAAGDGGGCTYPGQPPQEMTQTFSSFVEIMDPNGFVFRRGLAQTGVWTVCQKNTTDGSFGFPTSFGNITINTPAAPSESLMSEIDGILASLKKQ